MTPPRLLLSLLAALLIGAQGPVCLVFCRSASAEPVAHDATSCHEGADRGAPVEELPPGDFPGECATCAGGEQIVPPSGAPIASFVSFALPAGLAPAPVASNPFRPGDVLAPFGMHPSRGKLFLLKSSLLL